MFCYTKQFRGGYYVKDPTMLKRGETPTMLKSEVWGILC
jgi:hypothetical protein